MDNTVREFDISTIYKAGDRFTYDGMLYEVDKSSIEDYILPEYEIGCHKIPLEKVKPKPVRKSNKFKEIKEIEKAFGFDIRELFTSDYTGASFEMELEPEDGEIYFDGDSFYGHYKKHEFLELIMKMLNMYRLLVASEKERNKDE